MMEVKTYTFYAPCPLLDIEAMQTWLEDMSMEGYLLKDCSKARHKFYFYKIEPLSTRYRLTLVSDKIEEWNLRPNEEFVSISEAYGWNMCVVITDSIFSEPLMQMHAKFTQIHLFRHRLSVNSGGALLRLRETAENSV